MKLTRNRRPNWCAHVALALAALAALSARPARAMSPEEARAEALIRQGVQLRAEDQTARALPIFQEAYRVARTPRTAAQLGLCELELRDYVDAERHLAEALATPQHPWIARNKRVLSRQLESARANIGELVLTVSPVGADVFIDKKALDPALLSGPIRLAKGEVEVEVRAPGYQSESETIAIAAGQRLARTFALVPQPPKPAVAARQTGTPGSGSARAASAPGADLTSAPGASHPTSITRTAAWVTAGVAVGALAFGAGEAFSAASRRDAFNGHTGTSGGVSYPDCGTANLNAACKPLKDAYDQALTLSIVGFASAGALAITSTVLFVLSSSPGDGGPSSGAERALTCAPDVGRRGFDCALRF
jgi:hypothetical protein